IRMNGKDMQRLTFGDYTHTVSLSPEANYFLTTYSNVATPTKIALIDTRTKSQKEIADSKGPEFDQYQLAKTDLLRTKSSDGLFDLPFTITWPANYDRSKKYPVLISIYGGPNAGTVTDGWKGLQPQWYAKEGMIQVSMDHRGSGHFGKVGQNYMYKDLGDWELKDYTDVVKWLEANANVDPAKVCITGFSYGGYMTCMALTKAADVFTHGMAGGSVADWSLYDTHYTERFMGTKQDNAEGYKTSSVFPYINNYKGMLQIVHGNMDDNVHLQNSIQIIAALEDAKKDFEFMIYPGGRHGWGNLPARSAHFNNLKTKFIYRYLLEKPVPKEILQ
ncbi:MAG: family peptidase, partial [Chitinophagaceae bacterium]|nr:family peptidase [Chitinophagaceae bacterium]